ncbi:MAG: hypothetical protein ABFS35_18650 [Bacteroidota bacterium]
MNDTPKYMLQKQFEIVNSKSLKEKFLNLFDLTELSIKIISNQIRTKKPDISNIDLKVELFEIFYKDDFDSEELGLIINEIKSFHKKNETHK